MIRERLRLPWALLLLGACALAYANGLTGAFTYDDKAIVRDNVRLRSPERVVDLFTTQYFGGPTGTGTAYRPLLLLIVRRAVVDPRRGSGSLPRRQSPVARRGDAAPGGAAVCASRRRRSPSGRPCSSRCTPYTSKRSPASSGGARRSQRPWFWDVCSARCVSSTANRGGGGRMPARCCSISWATSTKESAAIAPALFFLILAWSEPVKGRFERAGAATALRASRAASRSTSARLSFSDWSSGSERECSAGR